MGEGYELPEPLGAVPIRCLGPSARRMLAIFLDPPACIITDDNLVPDASGLAELAGFDHVMIRFFENKPNKTEAILDNWRSCDNGTLGNLVKYLIQLERFDCLSEIWDKIVADAQKWLRRRDSHLSVSDAHTSSHSPPGPTSTNIASRDVLLTTDDGLYARSTAKVIYGREKLRKKVKPVDNGIAQTYTACICCSDNDLDLARKIMDNLSNKARVFIPQDHLLSGGYEFEATAEIIEERCGGRIIVILSTYYTTSPACTFATQFAKTLDPDSKRRQIIPILKDEDAEFPRVLRGISMIKYHRCRDMQEFYKHLTQSLRLPTTQSKDVLIKNRQGTIESNALSLGTMLLHSSSIAFRETSKKESRTNDLNAEKDLSCNVSSSSVQQHLNISCSVNEDNVNPENTKVMSRSISEGSGNMTLEQNLSKSSKTPKSVTKVLKTFKDAFRKLDKKDVSKVVSLKHEDEVWKNSSEMKSSQNKHTFALENSTKFKKFTTLPLESCKPKETCSRVPMHPNSSPLMSSQSTEYLLKDNSCSSCRRDITSNGVCSGNRQLKNHHTARQFSLPTQSSLNYAGITGKQNYTISSRPPDGKDFEHCMAGEPVFELTL